MKGPRPAAHGDTDKGRARAHNEDRYLCEPELGIFAVIDGVGGESGGEVAAGLAAESLKARLSRRTTDTRRLIREAIALANTQIYDWAQKNPLFKGMACVLTVAVLDDGRMTVGHVGDSRLYVLRRGRIDKLTRDHSPVGLREDAEEISEAEAMQHPRRNEILRDVGSAPHQPDDPDFIDFYDHDFAPDTAVLLCSDGLSDMLTREEIRAVVERHAGDPRAAVEELIDAANEKGGKDNISVVLVEGERYAESLRTPKAGRRSKALDEPLPWKDERPIALKPTTKIAPPESAGPRPTPVHGAASVGRPFPWRPVLLALVGLALLAGVWFWREPLLGLFAPAGGDPGDPEEAAPAGDREVRPGGSIQEAIDRASPGQTVEVLPGDYVGPVRLRDGVSLVCLTPRGAVIRAAQAPPGTGAGGGAAPAAASAPAVGAIGAIDAVVAGERIVQRTVLAGFRIDAAGTAAAGLALADANVEARDLEIVGSTGAGVVIAGGRRPLLERSYLRGNRSGGVLLLDGAAPRLWHNLVAGNGAGTPGAAGLEICDGCRPALVGNRFAGNGGPPIRLLTRESPAGLAGQVDELFGWNGFGALPRDRAVQVQQVQTQGARP